MTRHADALEAQQRLWDHYNTDEGQLRLMASLQHVSDMGYEIIMNSTLAALRWGEPYWWDEEILDTLEVVSQTLPDAPLRHEDVPHRFGWFYFSRPVPMHLPVANRTLNVKAILWSSFMNSDDEHQPGISYAHGEQTSENIMTPDQEGLGIVAFAIDGSGRLAPIICSMWRFGFTMAERLADKELHPTAHNLDDVMVIADGTLRLLMSALLFLQQRPVASDRQALPRAARRRQEQARYPVAASDVRVVYLRKPKHAPSGNHVTVDWDHRWWIGAHWAWRRCGVGHQDRRRVIIWPYVKGPDHKPLEPPKRNLYAVVR